MKNREQHFCFPERLTYTKLKLQPTNFRLAKSEVELHWSCMVPFTPIFRIKRQSVAILIRCRWTFMVVFEWMWDPFKTKIGMGNPILVLRSVVSCEWALGMVWTWLRPPRCKIGTGKWQEDNQVINNLTFIWLLTDSVNFTMALKRQCKKCP